MYYIIAKTIGFDISFNSSRLSTSITYFLHNNSLCISVST